MKNLIDLGSQFIGFRDEATALKGKAALFLIRLILSPDVCLPFDTGSLPSNFFFPEALRRAEEHADALAAKLELSEKAREKAEKDAATIEGFRQRLQTADALCEKVAQQIERENAIIARFDT
jgi:hypothetical protein